MRGVHDTVCVAGVQERSLAVGLGDGGTTSGSTGIEISSFEVVRTLPKAAFGIVQEGLLCGGSQRGLIVTAGMGKREASQA